MYIIISLATIATFKSLFNSSDLSEFLHFCNVSRFYRAACNADAV